MRPNRTATLNHTYNTRLLKRCSLAPFVESPTNKRLIGFDNPLELFRFVAFHGLSDSVAQIPCSLIRDLDHSPKLAGRNAFLGIANQVDREKPLPQGKVRIMEQRAVLFFEQGCSGNKAVSWGKG